MEPIISVHGLVKMYGTITAVNGLDFSVPAGMCFGLLGPNGAGKTTTIEIIEGIMATTAGEVRYKGNPRTKQFNEEIGIQFQHTSLLSFLTVRETLETFSVLYPQPLPLDDLMDLCHLREIETSYNDRISGGQRQRLLLALALVNRPALIFLDEPSTGLDPQARRDLWDIVSQIKAEGKTIVLTTHYMEEAQYLCDRIAIMDHGRIIATGSPESLIDQYCSGVTISLPKMNFADLPTDNGLRIHEVGERMEIHADDVNQCLQQLIQHGVDLAGMQVRSPNLEDVFLHLTGRQLRD